MPTSTPPAGTPGYWSFLERVATGYARTRAVSAPGDNNDAHGVMLALQPYGAAGVLDLCAVLVLQAIDRCPAGLRDPQGCPDLRQLIHGQSDALTTLAAVSDANSRLGRGAVTAGDLDDAEQQIVRINELETAVAQALRVRPGHPKARRNVRRELSAQGEGAREAGALFGIVSEITQIIGRRTSPAGP